MFTSSKLYNLASKEHLFDEKYARNEAKKLIRNGESVTNALTNCLLRLENYRIKCKKNPSRALSYEIHTSICRKIQTAYDIHRWIINIDKEMEITNIIVVICVAKNIPRNCISKVILDYLI